MLLLILLAVNSERFVEFVNKTLLHAVSNYIYNSLFANIYCFFFQRSSQLVFLGLKMSSKYRVFVTIDKCSPHFQLVIKIYVRNVYLHTNFKWFIHWDIWCAGVRVLKCTIQCTLNTEHGLIQIQIQYK